LTLPGNEKKSKESSITETLQLDPENMTELADFETSFSKIADCLCNQTILEINGVSHRLAELEFYLKDNNHHDTFTHCDEQQLTNGKWYFHKTGSGFKGGSYKGLDITFSSRGHGGILIRAIQEIKTSKYIEGPSLVVDHILATAGAKDIVSLTKQETYSWDVESDKSSILCLKRDSSLDRKVLSTSGRVGLVLRTDNHSVFVMRPYRFMVFPLLVRKGRPHLILELFDQGKTNEEIVTLTGATKSSVSNYIESFNESKKSAKKTIRLLQ